MVRFSKFTSNKKLLKKFEKFLSKPFKKKKKKTNSLYNRQH